MKDSLQDLIDEVEVLFDCELGNPLRAHVDKDGNEHVYVTFFAKTPLSKDPMELVGWFRNLLLKLRESTGQERPKLYWRLGCKIQIVQEQQNHYLRSRLVVPSASRDLQIAMEKAEGEEARCI